MRMKLFKKSLKLQLTMARTIKAFSTFSFDPETKQADHPGDPGESDDEEYTFHSVHNDMNEATETFDYQL